MAFTRVWGDSGEGSTVTEHTVDVGSPADGDVVVVLFTAHNSSTTVTWPAGWTELDESNGGNAVLSIAWRRCDGGEGASITVTTNQSVRSAHSHCKVSAGHSGSDAPEIAVAASGSSTAPDPPSLTPSYGSREYLWIVAMGKDQGTDVTISAFPSGYGNTAQIDRLSGAAGAGLGRCDLVTTAASEDPGAATLDLTDDWVAQTVAVPGPAAGATGPVAQVITTGV